MGMNARFTAYLSGAEREGLGLRARELGTSENFIVRLAVRQYLGMPNHAATTVVTEGVVSNA